MTAMAKPAGLVTASSPASLCSQAVEGAGCDASGGTASVSWQLPEEVPVALQINSEPYTVMMATPANLAEFGIGFALSEGIVAKRADIRGALVMPVENGMTVDLPADELPLHAARLPPRAIAGPPRCRLRGVEHCASVVPSTHPVTPTLKTKPFALSPKP